MQKLFGGAFIAVLLTFVGVGSTAAITFEDVHTPDSPYLMKFGDTYSFEHSLTGFVPNTITQARIDLVFYDDSNDPWYLPWETILFTFDGKLWESEIKEIENVPVHFNLDTELLSNGILQVNLLGLGGDVYFDHSTLTIEATAATPMPTPEPSALLLLGSGLVGLVFMSRKRLRAKQVEAA